MDMQEARNLLSNGNSFRALLEGIKVEVSFVHDDGKAQYRVVKRGRPKFLTEQIDKFIIDNS